MIILVLVHFGGHHLYIITTFILTRYLNLSTLVDTNLSAALHDCTLISAFVHFSGRTAFILFKYNVPVKSYSFMRIFILLLADRLPFLSVHFSGHPSFRRVI